MLRNLMMMVALSCPIFGLGSTGYADDEPTAVARRIAEEIKREALLPPNGSGGRPLPLASHWNVGTVAGTFGPDHQIGLLQHGHHVLPWMAWPEGDPGSDDFQAYSGRLLKFYAALGLPFSIRGTQWEAMLVTRKYREGPEEKWAGVIAPDGARVPKLSPFGPIEPWKDPAKEYIDTAAMKRAQEIYPDPPLVFFLSNNEAPDLRWSKEGSLEELSKRYLDRYGRGRDDEFRRRVVAEGWIERYPVMFNAMRAALVNETWQKNVRFTGYGAFGPSHLGRWDGWKVYSLTTDKFTAPDYQIWDGGSPSYYTHNWNQNRDHWLFSCQVESMNWVFMLEEAWQANPDFWFEMSTWDGNDVKGWMSAVGAVTPEELVKLTAAGLSKEQRGKIDPALVKKSKVLQYLANGQSYSPERSAGWVQFGMWLLRPRVVREFRSHATQLAPIEPYWMETVKAVDRVWENETLAEFWRHGELVKNTAHKHPYDVDVPEKYQAIDRWYLLDTSVDSARPWGESTNIPVFSLALVAGKEGARRWLVFAHSPLEDRRDVAIRIPGHEPITVDVLQRGSFFAVDESTRKVTVVK